MNRTELALVQSCLDPLIGQQVHGFSRQQDMLLVTFGEQLITLRIQCYFRLMERGDILMAHNDVYQPASIMWSIWEGQGYAFDEVPEDFCYDEPGVNRLDESIAALNADLSGMAVQSLLLGHTGDLTVVFTCGAVLQVMVDTSGDEECWRLMDSYGSVDDLVVYADGAELASPQMTEDDEDGDGSDG